MVVFLLMKLTGSRFFLFEWHHSVQVRIIVFPSFQKYNASEIFTHQIWGFDSIKKLNLMFYSKRIHLEFPSITAFLGGIPKREKPKNLNKSQLN